MKNKRLKNLFSLLGLSLVLFAFQNCSDVNFATVQERLLICDPLSGSNVDCDNITNGFRGRIYYFSNNDTSGNRPDYVYDIFNTAISFPDGITGVSMFFTRGHQVNADLIMSRIYVPTIRFSQGFKYGNNNYLRDKSGNILVEAFAFQVDSKFTLSDNMQEGRYEFAILSDDGAMVLTDEDRNGSFDVLVNNDGNHSTALGCSEDLVTLQRGQELPIRVQYYQGPRTEIAVTLLARKVPDNMAREMDPYCGYTSRTEWFNGDPNDANYVPDPVSAKFGDLIERGWFVPDASALNL